MLTRHRFEDWLARDGATDERPPREAAEPITLAGAAAELSAAAGPDRLR
jgi:hypothetical protein